MTAAVIAAIAVVNLGAVWLFRADKRAAGMGLRRVPERSFLLLAALGAAPGLVWATFRFRHKTRKEPFRTLLLLILAVQAVALTALALIRLVGS